MYIRSKYISATNSRGSRIQFSLVDGCMTTTYRKWFPYDLEPPANVKERIQSYNSDEFDLFESLSKKNQAMVCMFQDFLEYLNKKMKLHPRDQWKYVDFTMVMLDGSCDMMFIWNCHAIKLG